MDIKPEVETVIGSRIAEAWPGTTIVGDPVPLTGGFWASMFRLRLRHQPEAVPADVVFRIAPDAAMGAKELAVQEAVAEMGFPTPRVRLTRPSDVELGGAWSVMDFAEGTPPLGDLNGAAALRRARKLFNRLSAQLAAPMAALHALDPEPVGVAVGSVAPTVSWRVSQLLEHFEDAATVLARPDLVQAVRALGHRRPSESATVICHGDLHPFNLLVTADGAVTVIDWTAALRAEPAYDVAFTAMLLANPPLEAPGPLGAVIRWVGARLARRFVDHYRTLAPGSDLGALDWYRALHGIRILIESASIEARNEPGGAHPFGALVPAASSTVTAFVGIPIAAD